MTLLGKVWRGVSFEFLLTRTRRANGGGVVLTRTLGVSLWLYILAVVLKEVLDPEGSLRPSGSELRKEMIATLPWFGAMFAAVYASLITRFSSQWLYLASLYNQIKAIEARTAGNNEAKAVLAEWKAGFLEDADTLHLVTKPLFVSTAKMWGAEPTVQQWFSAHAVGGASRLSGLMTDVVSAYSEQQARWQPTNHAIKAPVSEPSRSSDWMGPGST